jgi:hypothetical protein
MASKKSMRFTGNRTAAIGLIVVCIVGTAILIAMRSSESTSAATAAPASTLAPSAPTDAGPARAERAAAPAARAQSGDAVKAAQNAEPVTIEGCLVQDNEAFRLKNTGGEDAPKGRSWKSGFLKKSSKTIELVDARHRMNLARHVGERVSVTGMLEERELQGTSIKRLAESCE